MSGRGSLYVRQVLNVVNLRLTRNWWGEAPERLQVRPTKIVRTSGVIG